MGRSSASTKRSPATTANQHNTKHENGIVGPGKRIPRQRSSGHLNGISRPAERTSSSTPPLPATPPPANGQARLPAELAYDQRVAPRARRASLGTYSETSSSESCFQNGTNLSDNHRRIDVNAAKNPAVHRDAGPMSFILTVLRSCPLYDTIAILIVLLQIPPTFMSLIHILFASLTFVPPLPSTHSSFTFTDIFEGTLGMPSIATILAVDLLVLLLWLFLWSPLQDISIDLAQTVIALTLGGGTTGRDAGFNNVLVCLGIIGVSHFTRSGSIKRSGLRILLPSIRSDSKDPLDPTPQSSKKCPHGWLNIILALHILTQGVLRYIRDWYVRRERRDSIVSSLGDPEAAKGLTPDSIINESTSNTSNPMTPDLDSLGSFPVHNFTDKMLNPKKKRKVSAQVRIRQPLWAALASTKIVMAKEYETSRTAAESAGSNATDINNLGNAPFDSQADRIWITHVDFDQVCFSTSFFPSYSYPGAIQERDNVIGTSGIDKSKPFFVRVNKTTWKPTRINAVADSSTPNTEQRWSGEIFGLAPMSSYECEFVSTVDGSTIFATSIRTTQASIADIASPSALSSGGQRPARPDSPTTTLKTSIATAEAKSMEERSRQKRERKEQKTKMNVAKKEIDKLTSLIASSGGNDDRLRQKVHQSNLHAKQANDAVAHLNEQLEMLEKLPDDHLNEWKRAKSAWHAQKDAHKTQRNGFHEAKATAELEVQALTAEASSMQQKRERMQSRVNKLNSEHERLTDANAKGFDEAQRKESERVTKEAERARIEMMYMERLDTYGPQIQEKQQALNNLWANINSIQQAEYLAAQMQTQTLPSPSVQNPYDIPEATVANTSYPWNPPGINPLGSQAGPRTRGRSSSMLSAISGFTQSSAEEFGPPREVAEEAVPRRRQRSDGSCGGSVAGSSVGDPKSPVVASTLQGKWGHWDEK